MSELNQRHGKDRKKETEELNKQLEVHQNRLEKAQALMLDGLLDMKEYQSIKGRLEPEINRLISKVDTAGQQSKNVSENDIIRFGFYFLNNLDKLFTIADLKGKRTIIGSMFPQNLIFENNSYRTTSEDNVLLLLAAMGKDTGRKKECRKDMSFLHSRGVARTGIELISFPRHYSGFQFFQKGSATNDATFLISAIVDS